MVKLFIPENHRFVRKTDFVIESIRTAILLGYIKPGTKITEKEIKDTLEVSSSPIREALNQLEAEGLLTKNPYVGTKVTEIDVVDARELYSIQALLQGTAVQISTLKMKDEDINEAKKINHQMSEMIQGEIDVDKMRVANYKFHMIVCGMNIYPWLTRLISSLWVSIARVRSPTQTVWLVKNEPVIIIDYHNKIIKAIENRKDILAGNFMKKHMQRSKKVLFD